MSRYNPGELVSGKYRIMRLIGDGGMGVVYEARHEVLGSSVALKFLHADLAKRPGLTQRFLQEARVSATIQSPHVTHVTDVDTSQDGSPYLVMELLSGQSLQAMMDWQGKLPLEQAVDFGLQILAGLEAAHALGVVHRDMKPDNVFVTATSGGPLLKLIDFGIAKLRASSEYTKGLTRAGVVMGTPEYMAPEQLVSAHTTDHRADLYSVGVILFEMLAGCRPADGEDADIIVAAVEAGRVRHLPEVVPELPPALVALIERAMAPNRELRFDSASEMRLALAPFAGQLSHAGRLAAVLPPLPPAAVPASAYLSSLPPPGAAATAAAASNTSVPKTLPPDAPPLSVSQLGAARTSLSQDDPILGRLPTGTAMAAPAMGGPGQYGAPGYAPPPGGYGGAQLAQPSHKKGGRSGFLVALLVLVVLGGGGAVGFAAYRAADRQRVVPPLPDPGLFATASTTSTTPSGIETIRAENPDVVPTTPTGVKPSPATGTGAGTKPTGQGGASTGGGGPVVVGSGGSRPNIGLPFPLPSIQIPSTLPPLQLPPGLTFPPGFPGVPQPTPTTPPASTPATPPATTPPAQPPAQTPTTTPNRNRTSSKP